MRNFVKYFVRRYTYQVLFFILILYSTDIEHEINCYVNFWYISSQLSFFGVKFFNCPLNCCYSSLTAHPRTPVPEVDMFRSPVYHSRQSTMRLTQSVGLHCLRADRAFISRTKHFHFASYVSKTNCTGRRRTRWRHVLPASRDAWRHPRREHVRRTERLRARPTPFLLGDILQTYAPSTITHACSDIPPECVNRRRCGAVLSKQAD